MGPSDEQLLHAFDQAPLVIQDSLTDGSAVQFMSKLTSRYGIHIDTAGYVSEFIRNMLLGFVQPDRFIAKLHTVGIDDVLARQLTSDLNKEVFIPLRDEVRKKGDTLVPKNIPHVPLMSVVAPRPIPQKVPEAKASEPASFNLIRPSIEPSQDAAAPIVPGVPRTVYAPAPTMRTMQHDMAMLEQGHMPDPYLVERPATMSPTPHPSQMTPAREFQTASVPYTSNPQQPVQVPAQAIVRAPLPPTPQPQALVAPPIKEQSGDPYRESI